MEPWQPKPEYYQTWEAFLKEWPLERLAVMTLPEYTQVGNDNTFTAWLEQRLDKLGSIWGGSSFKFGIYSRKSRVEKRDSASASYSTDYAWYSKYGDSPQAAFAAVKAIVNGIARSAAAGDYAAIDEVDLGTAYKWKIAFHYQDRSHPGVLAAFKRKRLQKWLTGRIATVPKEMSDLYREVIARNKDEADLLTLSAKVWGETADPEPTPSGGNGDDGDDVDVPDDDPPTDNFPDQPLNLVLYGPPGTGKTFKTAEIAVGICDGKIPQERAALMDRYRKLKDLHRIRFVTFHPSFAYEEFVEGIRPSTENGQVRYAVRPGIFKQVVTHARELFERRASIPPSVDLTKRGLFKMSLGDTSKSEEAWLFPDAIENEYIALGFAKTIDFTGADSVQAVRDRYKAAKPDAPDNDFSIAAVQRIKNELRENDLVLVSDGNRRFRAIGQVVGPYRFLPRDQGYSHTRKVRWLWTGDSLPIAAISKKNLSQQTIYRIDTDAVNWTALGELLSPARPDEGQAPNCVLVIDEINRANLAKTLGELITLLEPSKRLGEIDEQETDLPYSGERFGIPPNLHVVGTMNTADRSIALLDLALRRRFEFREMSPDPALLAEDLAGTNLRKLLRAMNLRIENLIDRDHTLGHTYLMGLSSFDELATRFRTQIIPLLQEYFFDDWGKIQQVFNDQNQTAEKQIIQRVGDGDAEKKAGDRPRYQVNPAISPATIQKIYEGA